MSNENRVDERLLEQNVLERKICTSCQTLKFDLESKLWAGVHLEEVNELLLKSEASVGSIHCFDVNEADKLIRLSTVLAIVKDDLMFEGGCIDHDVYARIQLPLAVRDLLVNGYKIYDSSSFEVVKDRNIVVQDLLDMLDRHYTIEGKEKYKRLSPILVIGNKCSEKTYTPVYPTVERKLNSFYKGYIDEKLVKI